MNTLVAYAAFAWLMGLGVVLKLAMHRLDVQQLRDQREAKRLLLQRLELDYDEAMAIVRGDIEP